MQFLLGGYATWWNQRHRRSGHVFQGRFRGHLVEDETYFWTVSRYAQHLTVGRSLPLQDRQMDFAVESRDRDTHNQLLLEELSVHMDEVIRTLIALVHQRIVHIQGLDPRLTFKQADDVRVVFPQRVSRGAHIDLEAAW